jgi:hypothetical protein
MSLRERAPSFEQVGGEAAALLQEGGRSAEQPVENGRRRAGTIIERAEQQAEQLRRVVPPGRSGCWSGPASSGMRR